ncbi:MAG: GIY-YIG nuclease family protein [Candidatus Hadarchaeaceae archaeon]
MDPGIYALLIYVPYDLSLNIGQLGAVDFKRGYYAYVGSALGGISTRVRRHLRREKKLHWHVDHLLLHARAVDVVAARGRGRKECSVAAELAKRLSSIKGFGSSDCDCKSHLFYSPDFDELRTVVAESFKECGVKIFRFGEV